MIRDGKRVQGVEDSSEGCVPDLVFCTHDAVNKSNISIRNLQSKPKGHMLDL